MIYSLIYCWQKWMNTGNTYQVQISILFCIVLTGCSIGAQKTWNSTIRIPADRKPITFRQPIYFEKDFRFAMDVTIMPGALIATARDATVTFGGKVNVLGESHVFETQANLQFEPGAISMLNVGWFGAKGYDNEDDTHSFKRVLQIAFEYFNSLTVEIPNGRYFISETLQVHSNPHQKKSINFRGSNYSNSGIQGANLSWRGQPMEIMMEFSNVSHFFVEGIDFTAETGSKLLHTISFKPFVHQVFIRNCSFSGAAGANSSNVNINQGNGDQVSEIHFDNCTFAGHTDDGSTLQTPSAISGGLFNTKNFYIQNCIFQAFAKAAINIRMSEVFRVESCTFANNEVDIFCGLGGSYIISNYSEASRCFFEGSFSSNIATTTLINNVFAGNPKDGYVIRDGSGRLYMVNNMFGNAGSGSDLNRVRWEADEFNTVFSQGNFFKNTNADNSPFHDRANRVTKENVTSINDMGGQNGLLRVSLDKN